MSDCHHTQNHILAYINGELPPKRRVRIGKHLQHCPACYATYIHQRDTARQITQVIGGVSNPSDAQKQLMWQHIGQALHSPSPPPARHGTRLGSLQTGAVAAAFLLMFILPWSFSNSSITSAAQLENTPPETQQVSTPVSKLETLRTVAYHDSFATQTPQATLSISNATAPRPDETP